jgi:hypothetical protein
LLKTLDELAGEEVELEDTGVEWRLRGKEDDELDVNPDDDAAALFEFGDDDSDGDLLAVEYDDPDENFDRYEESGPGNSDADTILEFGGIFEDDSESRIDELLDDRPTPVDEFLSNTPNQVEAAEVFDGESGNLETRSDAAEIFSAPRRLPEDELRFDDNTGLPDDFDFDNLPPTNYQGAERRKTAQNDETEAAAPEPEPEHQPTDFSLADAGEWDDLLDEVAPATAEADHSPLHETQDIVEAADAETEEPLPPIAESDDRPKPETEVRAMADSESDFDEQSELESELETLSVPGDGNNAIAAEASLSLTDELRALPDDAGNDAVEESLADEEDSHDLQAEAASIDLSGIYEMTPDLVFEEMQAEADEAVNIAEPLDEPADGVPDEVHAEDSQPLPMVSFEETIEASELAFPDSTGELEFELVKAQEMQDAEMEIELDPEHYVPPPTPEEQTVNMLIDQDLMRLAIPEDDGLSSTMILDARKKKSAGPRSGKRGKGVPEVKTSIDLTTSGSTSFETIIMEGDYIRTALEQERLAAEAEAHGESNDSEIAALLKKHADQDKKPTRDSRRLRYGLAAGVLVLALVLAGQFVHQSRAELATNATLAKTIGPIYRAAGAPISPQWDVRGWRFEVTKGSTNTGGLVEPLADDETGFGITEASESDALTDGLVDITTGNEVLTIYSRVGNKSDNALPYPLISVSLTDRFEETLGSKVLEPADYLTGDFDSSKMVAPGENFNAVISVAAPSESATGFKLNVCYRQTDGRLRCAFEDFK